MAISHVCQGCGSDVSDVRARIEPRYGLPIVTCGECRTVSVRRQHPLHAGWLRLKKVDFALTVLVMQAGMAAVMLALWCVTLPWIGITTAARLSSGLMARELSAEVVFVAVVLAGTATWLRFAFARVRYRTVVARWVAVVVVGQLVSGLLWAWMCMAMEGHLMLDTGAERLVGTEAWRFSIRAYIYTTAGSAVAMALVSPIGFATGTAVLHALTTLRRYLRERHKRRLRWMRAG